MVKGHHLQLKSYPSLFNIFLQFNNKASVAHHPIIQKDVDELDAKGGIEPSSSSTGFYSNLFVVS